MLSQYYVELRTGEDYDVDSYDQAAGRLANVIVSLLSDTASLDSVTHNKRDSCNSEVEVMLEEGPQGRELVAKAVIDILAEVKVKFDKAKFSKLVKAHPGTDEWPNMRVAKKQVPQV